MIKKILIANRGEIAMRVMRTCKEMEIATVAVYSEIDRTSWHVRYADEAYCIGAAPSNESYLCIDKILAVAKQSGADAIHPGYGFLSENADFATRCEEEGIVFIGPSAYAISCMGDKIKARETMIAAGVTVVPGSSGSNGTLSSLVQDAKKIGLPVMIKATAGGGGKGMRLVKEEKDLENAIEAARSEAKSAFGDDTVYIEKYITSPHHIEFQILADKHGNTVHLFERECSIQRRHQKVIEETPSPLMTSELREEMGAQAVAAAKAVNYSGAGTIEFIVDDDRNYYFLEMNTRLQVEHPITEQVVGIDLVREMIRISNGEKLGYEQADLRQRGHAIEVRICAEDAAMNFIPSPGKIHSIQHPRGLGVRHDGFAYSGYTVSMHYDPMIAKLIIRGKTRQEAIDRLNRALETYRFTGIKTNIHFLQRIIEHPVFTSGNYTTQFIDEHLEELLETNPSEQELELSAMTALMDYISAAPMNSTVEEGRNWQVTKRRFALRRL